MSPIDPTKAIRVNSAMLIMGPTGSGKSSLLATLAEWGYDTFGKVTRLVTTDGGGFPTRVQGLMQKGIMEVWRARTRDLPDGSLSFETCLRAAQGWWPRRLNARTGECPPGEPLVPPITEQYQMHCPNGHLIKTVAFQALLTPQMCPTCRTHTTKDNMRVVKTAGQTRGFEHVGLVCFDGLSSMLSWMLSDMGQRSGRLELKGEEGAIGGKILSGDLRLGGNTRSHIGFAQSRAEELALNSLSIPFLVHPPVWTALTDEATDEGGLSIKGPKLAGHARTADAPSWFGDCLEAGVIKDEKDRRVYRLYLAEYVDDAGCRHLCKNRADPGCLPPFLEDPPADGADSNPTETAFTQFNLGLFRQLEDKALERTLTSLDAKYPDAPGVAEGWVEVGGGTDAASASEAPVPSEGAAPTPGAGQPASGKPLPASGPGAPAAGTTPVAPAPAAGTPAKPAGGPRPAPRAPVAAKAPATRPAVTQGQPAAQAAPAAQPAKAAPAQPADAPPAQTAVQAAQPAKPAVAAAPAVPAAPAQPAAQPKVWAPPGAPRPPAAAPRLRPQARPSSTK